MDSIHSSLLACFQAVFPAVGEADLAGMSQAAFPEWDSVAAVTLIRLVEEQFELQLDLFDLGSLDSFAALEAYIRERVPTAS